YFLKSTDYLCSHVNGSIVLNFEQTYDSSYVIVIEPEIDKNWCMSFRGWIKPELVKESCQNGFFAVEINKIETLQNFLSKFPKNDDVHQYHKNKRPGDLSIHGKIIDESIRIKLITKYFETN